MYLIFNILIAPPVLFTVHVNQYGSIITNTNAAQLLIKVFLTDAKLLYDLA